MLILYDFKCAECGAVQEKLVDRNESGQPLPCDLCSADAVRVISPVRSNLEGLSGHFPDAADKWAKRHEKEGRKPSETDPRGW